MRSISLVEKVDLEFKGKIFQNALALVDIDADGANELCACNIHGDLHVFKGIHTSRPWKVRNGLGIVVVLCGGTVGDKSVLMSLDTEGNCHLFNVKVDTPASDELNELHQQKLQRNAKVATLKDIDEDGNTELVVGYTDRHVRVYKWQLEQELEDVDSFRNGRFTLVKQFSLLSQVGSIALCKTADGLNQVLVSQPNGGYCILGAYSKVNGFTDTPPNTPVQTESVPRQDSYPTFFPINPKSYRSASHTATDIIGGIRRNNKPTGVLGVCSQNGHFILLDNSSSSGMYPAKHSSSNRWLAMSAVDITRNGDDEIVLCSTAGMTYVIDKNRDIVSFDLSENVAAFCAGEYGSGRSPCLCYVTLSGHIRLYYNAWIDTMKVKCVHGALIERMQQDEQLSDLLDTLKLVNGEIDHTKVQSLVKYVWSTI